MVSNFLLINEQEISAFIKLGVMDLQNCKQ